MKKDNTNNHRQGGPNHSTSTPEKGDLTNVFCGMCGKGAEEVNKLFAGMNAHTCDGCAVMMNDLLQEDTQQDAREAIATGLKTPDEIKAHMDEHVIGQDSAKEIISTAVYNHYIRLQQSEADSAAYGDVEMEKSNILVTGSTGSGKTLMLTTLAEALDVPFAIADATTLTKAGYVGEDVESVITKLLQKCDYDIDKAQTGIIYVDEIDKIGAKASSGTLEVGGSAVQQALLKLIEGTVASVPPQGGKKHPMQELLQVDTSNILFICGGAFPDLEAIVKERLTQGTSAGFTAQIESETISSDQAYESVEPQDLQQFGLIPEFIGRLPVIATTRELDKAQLVQVLTEPKNAIVKQYCKHFDMHGVDLAFEQEALEAFADMALARKTGARGLRTMMERALLKTMFNLPKMAAEGVTKVTFSGDNIRNNTPPALDYGPRSESTAPAYEAAKKHGVQVEKTVVQNRLPPGGICVK